MIPFSKYLTPYKIRETRVEGDIRDQCSEKPENKRFLLRILIDVTTKWYIFIGKQH